MSSEKKEVNHSRARAGCRRGKSKPRHKFTNDELKRLKQEFKCTPYPDFTTRDELARQFRCQVDVIDNWFQNKRARTPQELKDTFSAIRGMRKSGDYTLIGRQDTQVQASNCDPGQISYTQVAPGGLALCFVQTEEASGEQYGSCDYVVQSIGAKSSGVVDTLPPVSEARYVGDQPETQESQYSTFSPADYVPCMQGQRQMDYTYSPMFPGQQQNNWEYQQQQQHPQSYQERASLADWLIVHQSHRDLGQQVSSFFPSEHQDQFAPSNGDAVGS